MFCRTVTFQSSYFPRTVKLWNSLPLAARQSNSFEMFRSLVKAFYQDKLVSTFDCDDTNTWVSIGSMFQSKFSLCHHCVQPNTLHHTVVSWLCFYAFTVMLLNAMCLLQGGRALKRRVSTGTHLFPRHPPIYCICWQILVK